jgi:hypothetical protein
MTMTAAQALCIVGDQDNIGMLASIHCSNEGSVF